MFWDTILFWACSIVSALGLVAAIWSILDTGAKRK